jgi:hypothetical protein
LGFWISQGGLPAMASKPEKGGPEPDGAPGVEGLAQSLERLVVAQVLAVVPGSPLGVEDGHAVDGLQGREGAVVQRLGRAAFDEVVDGYLTVDQVNQLALDGAVAHGLDRPGPFLLGKVDTAAVTLVAAFAVPGQDRIVAEAVEPAADERVAGLELVIEEFEGEIAVEGLDPEREAAELHGEGVDVDAVEAALDDVAFQDRPQARLEALVVGPARQRLLDELPVRRPSFRQRDQRLVALGGDAAVMVQAGVESFGQEAKARDQERARAHRRVADLERQNLLGLLRRPLRRRRVLVRVAASQRRIGGQRAQGPVHRRHRERRPRVERSRALARTAPAYQEPFPRKDRAGDQRSGGGIELRLVPLDRVLLLRRRLPDQLPRRDGTPRPALRLLLGAPPRIVAVVAGLGRLDLARIRLARFLVARVIIRIAGIFVRFLLRLLLRLGTLDHP